MRFFQRKKQLVWQNAVWHAAYERNVDAISLMTPKQIVDCNEATVRLLRARSKDDILAKHPRDLAPEFQPDGRTSREVSEEKVAVALKEGHARFEWLHLRFDGTTFPVQITLIPVKIDGQSYLLSFRQDIQELVAAREEKRAALLAMAGRIETDTGSALEQIRGRTAAMTATADAMSASASRTGASAETAAAAAAQALANAQTVATAAEQLSASIREISGQVSQSAQVVSRAVEAGQETRTTIEALNQQVEQIGAVADMIGEIAAKTNLLALNATIEAARAGDAGKGFAVVASEVKQLANQTARSTGEIARHIEQVRAATNASVAAVAKIERNITEVNAIASSIATAVEQQTAATAEIARNVSATAVAANEMTSRTTEVSAEARETGGYSHEVRSNATALDTAMEELRHSVIRVVRTATPEVDRRTSPRHPVDLPCGVTVAGQTHSARVIDLSDNGACIRGGPPMQTGRTGTLDVHGVGMPLPFTVKRNDGDGVHVEFTLDAASAAKFKGTPERFAQQRRAA